MRSHAMKDGYHNVGKDKLSIVNHVHNISNFGAEFFLFRVVCLYAMQV
jgi:hypothetical protein